MKLVALALALLVVPLAAGAVPRSAWKHYTTGEGEVYLPSALWPVGPVVTVQDVPVTVGPDPFPACPFTGDNVGGACFALDGSESAASLQLHDALTSNKVAADAQVLNATGGVLASLAFCDHTDPPFPIPHGGTTLAVYVYDAAYGSLVCSRTSPTIGNISVTFS